MQYFKSIHHVYIVCVFVSHCNIYKPVPTPRYTSKSMELQTFPAQYKLTVNKMSAHITRSTVKPSTLLAIHPSHLFQECKTNIRFPQQYMTETLVITCLQCYCTGHKTHHHNSKTRPLSVLLLT